MRNTFPIITLTLLSALALVVGIARHEARASAQPKEERTFTCYDRTELVQEHWGVKRAIYIQDAMWLIEYVDSEPVYFHQPMGWVCAVETPVTAY